MTTLNHARGLLAPAAAALLVATLVPSFASCATTQQDTSPPPEASTLPPSDTDAGAPLDASPEAGCDAADDACVSHVITCLEAAWCPVATKVSALYALTSVWGSSKNDVWAVGSGGTIVHYDGSAWTPTPPTGLKNTFHAVTGSSATDVWVLSATDVILHSNGFTGGAAGGSATWTQTSAARNQYETTPLFAAWGTPAGDLRVGGRSFALIAPNGDFGSGNQLSKSTLADGGVAWVGTSGQATVNGIWGSSPDDLWIVADNSATVSWQLGLTLHGTRAGDAGDADGLAWQSVDSQSPVALTAVWGSSANDVWALGDKGTIRHLANDKTHWDPSESKTTADLHGLWGSAANDIWAVGDTGTILHYDGTSWSPSLAALPLGKRPHLYGVWGSSRDDVWIVGDGIALHYTGTGTGGAK
jgi:hypothetical protein